MHSAVGVGAFVWGAYAVAEVAFLVVWPLFAGHEQFLLPVHWRFLGLSVAAYLVAGAMLGAVAAWVGRRAGLEGAEATERLAVLTLVTAYLLNLGAEAGRWNTGSKAGLVLGVTALAAVLGGLLWGRLEAVTRPWSDPWTVAILLAGGPLVAPRFRPATVAGIVLLSAAAFGFSRLLLRRGAMLGRSGLRWPQAAALAAALAAVPFVILAVEQEPKPMRGFE